jgi:hypothetical protein
MTVAARELPAATNVASSQSEPPAVLAVATAPPEPVIGLRALLIIGSALLVAAVALLFWVVRRSRAAPQSSFISRSMDGG